MGKKWIVSFLLTVIIVGLIATCKPAEFFPSEGKWYCKELEMQLDFSDTDGSFIIRNEQIITCAYLIDPGSPWLFVAYQENIPPYYLGEQILSARFISLSDSEFIVYDECAQQQYTFFCVGD